MERRLAVFLFCASLLALGCSRESKKHTSTITIQVPRAANSFSKTGGVGAMAAMPSDRKTCYGASVFGPGLTPESGGACAPTAGIRGGFVEPGGTLQMQVPKGSGRTVELYAFLQSPGQNSPCPGFVGNSTPAQVAATYKIGSKLNVDMMGEETKITINAEFPGLNNNYAVEMNLPSFCANGPTSVTTTPGFNFGSGLELAVSGSTSLRGGVGRAQKGITASNGSISLRSK